MLSALGSVSACRTSSMPACARACRMSGSVMIWVSLGVARHGQLEGVALGAAVALEEVLLRGAQVLEELPPLVRWDPDLTGDPDGRQLRSGPVQRGDVGLDLFHQVQQVAEAQLVASPAEAADPADEP